MKALAGSLHPLSRWIGTWVEYNGDMLLRATLDARNPGSILIVLPTWVGDFVMATPALRAIRRRYPDASITFLMEPNLRDLVRGGDWMDECIEYPSARRSSGTGGPRWGQYRTLVGQLRARRFDRAILLPNSFRAALIARLSGARRRMGYDRNGRGFLLTDRIPVKNRTREWWRSSAARCGKRHPARITAIQLDARVADEPLPYGRGSEKADRGSEKAAAGSQDRVSPGTSHVARSSGEGGSFGGVVGVSWRPVVRMGRNLPVKLSPYEPMPLVEYYADLVEYVGCPRPDDRLELFTTRDCDASVASRLSSLGIADHHPLVVVSPGARYGAAKCWFPDRFASVADRLTERNDAAVCITCGPGEEPIARQIGDAMRQRRFVFDVPRLTLGEMKSLVRRCDLLICNDAGPRHFAKAFDVPVVTVFGPTHPTWTATTYGRERVVRIDVECGPCQQRVCPLGHLQCMTGVTVDAVYEAAAELLESGAVTSVEQQRHV